MKRKVKKRIKRLQKGDIYTILPGKLGLSTDLFEKKITFLAKLIHTKKIETCPNND